MTHLILVRHGQTDWNVAGRWQGQADPPLNERGREQARGLPGRLDGQPLEAIYTSDLQRARDTAAAVAEAFGLPLRVEKRLREINQGEWEGMLGVDIAEQYPEAWEARRVDPLHARPPGGESVVEVAERVWAAIDDITRAHPAGPVLIVSHGLALATVLCRVEKRPLLDARDLIPDNATPLDVEWPAPDRREAEEAE